MLCSYLYDQKKNASIKKNIPGPGWCGSVGWAPACKQKGRRLDSRSGHMPVGLVPSWELVRGNQSMFLSLSLIPPFPLSKKIKILKKNSGLSLISFWNWFVHCFIFWSLLKSSVTFGQVAWYFLSYFLFLGHVSTGEHFLIILIECGGPFFLLSPLVINCDTLKAGKRTAFAFLNWPEEWVLHYVALWKPQLGGWFYACPWQQIPQNEFHPVKKNFL